MSFVTPSKTNSLLVSLRPKPSSAFLVIGSNRLAAARLLTAIEGGYVVSVAFKTAKATIDPEILHRISSGEVKHIELDESRILELVSDLQNLEVLCVTDSLITSNKASKARSLESCIAIADYCKTNRILINVVDHIFLNDLSFPTTHRWRTPDDSHAHSLQIAVNTFGKGCRLATRIKREIVSLLPSEIGKAVDNIASIRARIMDLPVPVSENTNEISSIEDRLRNNASLVDEEDEQITSEPINTPVAQFGHSSGILGTDPSISQSSLESQQAARARRMKWVAQVSEYWPIKTIGRLLDSDIARILNDFDGMATPVAPTANPTPLASRSSSMTNFTTLSGLSSQSSNHKASSTINVANSTNRAEGLNSIASGTPTTLHSLNISKPIPTSEATLRVLLLGSGPGHPGLLTLAAYNALKTADLVLADKLVPSAILALIPSTVKTIIAKKFPGNAENAQIELQQLALDFLQQRKADGHSGTVVRLKQGDPYIYGRGGEEVLFFRQHGFETIIVPGISSAIAAPLLCNIPVTQRGVSDSLILCTGVGRAGKTSIMPGYRRSRTLIVLMGVARIGELITALTSDHEVLGTSREAARYPGYLPIALIERGSSRDQRMLLSTLEHVEESITRVGDQRPPGMLVIGWSCLALEGNGNVDVTEPSGLDAGESGDRARVQSVLGERAYLIRDGVRTDWMDFLDEMSQLGR